MNNHFNQDEFNAPDPQLMMESNYYRGDYDETRSNSVSSMPMSPGGYYEVPRWTGFRSYPQGVSQSQEGLCVSHPSPDFQKYCSGNCGQDMGSFEVSRWSCPSSSVHQSPEPFPNFSTKTSKRLKAVKPLKVSESISRSCPAIESPRPHPYQNTCPHGYVKCPQCSKLLPCVDYDPIKVLRELNPEDPLYEGNRRGRKTNNDDDRCGPDQKAKRDYARHYRVSKNFEKAKQEVKLATMQAYIQAAVDWASLTCNLDLLDLLQPVAGLLKEVDNMKYDPNHEKKV